MKIHRDEENHPDTTAKKKLRFDDLPEEEKAQVSDLIDRTVFMVLDMFPDYEKYDLEIAVYDTCITMVFCDMYSDAETRFPTLILHMDRALHSV